jgi:erythronate-4-phosphate dehydrogenase
MSSGIRIVADDAIPFLNGVLEPFADVLYLPGDKITGKDIKNADALLIRTRTKCNRDLLEGSSVRFIGSATIGFDHMDTAYCASQQIDWVNAPGCNAASVQQYIASALAFLTLQKGLDLSRQTLGIVGAGHVGSKVELLGRALGMNVLLNDPPRQRAEINNPFVSLEMLIRNSDIISLHVPLTREGPDATFHLFDSTLFSAMKKGSWLLNSSRGEVVDTVALKMALQNGHLGGSVLDVWENEPYPDPGIISRTTLGTPHIAGYSLDGKANGTARVVRALAARFGLPLTDWFPGDAILSRDMTIPLIRKQEATPQNILEIMNSTYDIKTDHQLFKSNPSQFEYLRKNYHVRRDFGSYNIECETDNPIASRLQIAGFRITFR